jgi:hypothetical protein
VENGGYGFFEVVDYVWDCPPSQAYADIRDPDHSHDDSEWHITIETFAKGLGEIRRAKRDAEAGFLCNQAGERMYLSGELYRAILAADRTNEMELDVIGALAILEIALFGVVVYA